MTKVFAYRNLHRQCWSVKALEGPLKGRVIYHANDLTLGWCDFKVSQAGRQRVLREQKRMSMPVWWATSQGVAK
jgi:hypothetical protein